MALRLTVAGATLVLLFLPACGGSPGPDDGDGTATLSGVVRAAESSEALSGATVSLGARQATSDESGQFELTGLPVGPATVHAARPGYLAVDAAVTIGAGANTQHFALAAQEVFVLNSYAAYVPAGGGALRGAIIALGGPFTSGFVTGEAIAPAGTPDLERSLQSLGASLRALAKSAHVALIGSTITAMPNNSGSDNTLFTALATAAEASGHAEIAKAPVLMFGLSNGGPEAAGLVSRNPERGIGLIERVPVSVTALTAPEALAVPTFVMQAELDREVDNSPVRTTFSENRRGGGLWALEVEPGVGHGDATGRGNAANVEWIETALSLRLPANLGDPLVPLDEASGWLGNQSTLDVAAWADYLGDRTAASWLPSESVATLWKQVGSSAGGGD